MSEPTVEVPARLALRVIRHLHHIGKHFAGTTGETACREMSDELQKHVVDQCTLDDIDVAMVAAELQDHK